MRRTLRGATLIGIALILAACTGGGSSTTPPAATDVATAGPVATSAGTPPCTDSTDPTTVSTSVADRTWAPVSGKVGDVITWTNGDGAPHRVDLDDGSCAMSESIPGGGTRSLVFNVAGSFPFHCGVHPSMKGTIVIA